MKLADYLDRISFTTESGPEDLYVSVRDGRPHIVITTTQSGHEPYTRDLLLHELGHIAIARDEDLFRPNLGMVPARAVIVKPTRVTISCPVTARRMLLEELCAFFAPTDVSTLCYGTVLGRAAIVARWLHSDAFRYTPSTNEALRDVCIEALTWLKTADVGAELARKFALIAGRMTT